MIVVLLGYMASGKSTIGRTLATQLNYEFLDLDDEISERLKMEIPEIFQKKGELFFRKKETEVLQDVLQSKSNLVLALGGGTPCYGTNMELIKEATPASFYLQLSISSLTQRLTNEKDNRPLVAHLDAEELPEFLGKHLFERASFYSQAAHTIVADTKEVDEIVDEIKEILI